MRQGRRPIRRENDGVYQYGGVTSMLRDMPDYAAEKTAAYNPRSIFENLSAFGYGVLMSDGRFLRDEHDIAEADASGMIVQTPDDYWRRGAGMCHDAAAFADDELTALGIEHKCFVCLSDVPPLYITHSYVVYREKTGFWRTSDPYSFQSGLSPHVYESMYEAGERRFLDWVTEENVNTPANAVFLMADRMPSAGRPLLEFLDEARDTFERIR